MKKMLSLLIFALTLGAMNAAAQNKMSDLTPEQRMERHTERMARKLNLDDKTAAKFNEIYKRYLTEMQGLRDQFQPIRPEAGGQLTDEQVEKNLLNRFARSRAILDVREKYYREFRKVLNVRQVDRIYDNEWGNLKRFQNFPKGKVKRNIRAPRNFDGQGQGDGKRQGRQRQ